MTTEKTTLPLQRPDRVVPPGSVVGRRAAVLGSPVSHSRSPDLHLAAYAALGLADWEYLRRECTAAQLPGLVAAAGPEYVGFSVTMPGKFAALEMADERTDRAVLVGSANTLVRTERGWRADCTDIDGMVGALHALGIGVSPPAADGSMSTSNDIAVPEGALVIGAGGTALPTVAALASVGITDLTVVARDAARARSVVELAEKVGMTASVIAFAESDDLRAHCTRADVVVSTVPADAVTPLIPALSTASRVIDVIYNPWPTPLAAAVEAAGGQVIGGLVMLLNQAFSQVEQFTGQPAPQQAMAAVLD